MIARWCSLRWLALALVALTLSAGCKKQKDPESVVPKVDPAELAEAAWARFVPSTQRAGFGLKIQSPTLGNSSVASGALIVDRPDRFRLEIYAPLVGPRFYAVSDGMSVNMYSVAQKTWMGGPDAEAVLREATGGTAGLKDVIDLLSGHMPFEDAEVTGVEIIESETRYTFEGPEGTRAVVAVDSRQLTTRSVEAFNTSGTCVLRATYSDYKRKDRALVPENLEIELPSIETAITLSFRDWEALDEPPDAFELAAPKGSTKLDLLEMIQGWTADAQPE